MNILSLFFKASGLDLLLSSQSMLNIEMLINGTGILTECMVSPYGRGVAGGGRGKFPPKQKKTMLFQKMFFSENYVTKTALVLVTKFPKIIKNSIFY